LKTKRHKKILELIQKHNISTQEEVAEALRSEGFNVTQATVSRDIKELGLSKVAIGNDIYKYGLPMEITVSQSRLKFMIKEFVLRCDYSENIIVIKTPPGNAQAVASVIDSAQWSKQQFSLSSLLFAVVSGLTVGFLLWRLFDYLN